MTYLERNIPKKIADQGIRTDFSFERRQPGSILRSAYAAFHSYTVTAFVLSKAIYT